MICGGMLNGATATRFSEITHSIPYKGNRANLGMRFNTGVYLQPETHPWNNNYLANTSASSTQLRDTNNTYLMLPVMLSDAQGVYGELDGIKFISGFNNVTENMCGTDWIVFQDVSRTSFIDYFAFKLDN